MAVTPRRSTRGQVFTPVSTPSVSVVGGGGGPNVNIRYSWTSSAKNIASSSNDKRVYYNSFARIKSANAPGTPFSLSGSVTPLGALTPKKKKVKPDEEARFALGDGVVVTVEGGSDGIGMLTALWDEPVERDEDASESGSESGHGDDEVPAMRKMAQVHWFLRRQDLPGVMRNLKLEDNEVLLAASPNRPVTTDLPLELLVKTIPIYSKAVFREQFPEEERKTKWKGWAVPLDNVFWCSRAYDKGARGGRVWKIDVDAWKGRGRAGEGWIVPTEPDMDDSEAPDSDDEGSGSEAEVSEGEDEDASSGEDEGEDEDKEEEEQVEATPRKRGRPKGSKNKPKVPGQQPPPRKRQKKGKADKADATHRRRRQPHVKASASHLPGIVQIEDLPADPYERALRLLHVGATPESLPCREEEFVDVLARVEEGVESGGGGCLYIAGVPGTGKTATVHAVVKELKRKAEDGEIAPFSYVEINGLKIPSPQHAYSVLWETISGQSGTSAKTALRGLEAHFGRKTTAGGVHGVRGPRGHTFVVLMDELDQLLTAKQDVVYNFFNWPTMRDSQLFVIAIANRMDLPQHLAAKIKSRLGLQTLLFQPYDRANLIEIVQSRLVAHPLSTADHKVLLPDAIALAATKMAGTNGDARRVLDACRRAVEVGLTHTPPRAVTARDMVAVLNAMSSSPVAMFIRQCSPQQKMLLAALVRCVRREGLPEIAWRAVRADHDALTRSLLESNDLLSDAELNLVRSSLLATHALTAAPDVYKAPDERRLALGMEIGEVGRVLMNEGEEWCRALAGT